MSQYKQGLKPRILLLILLGLVLLCITPVLAQLPPSTLKLLEYNRQLALSITFLAAFLAGMISFLSPCGFALLPIFFVTMFKEKKQAVYMASVFSVGLLITFTLFGAIAGIVGQYFNQYREFVALISGILVLIMGVLLLLNKGFGFEKGNRVLKNKSAKEVFLLGLFFGVAWSPCVMPVLTGIVLVGASLGNIWKSTALLAVFSLGAILPFLLLAYFSDRIPLLQRWLRQKPMKFSLFGRKVETFMYNIIAGLILIVLGIIIISWKGTSFFMAVIPQYIPWSMETAYGLNDNMTQGMFTHAWANWFGIALFLLVCYLLYRAIQSGGKHETKQR